MSRARSRTVVGISRAAPLGRLDRGKSDARFGKSSGCRPRKSPLASKGAFALLRDERKRKGLPTKLDGRDRTPLLAARAKRPYTTRGPHRLVATAAQLAGIDKPVSPHWLRHSFATLAAVGGAPPYQLQADLGHARLETSQRYVHWAKGLADSAVDRLPTSRFT
jgi:site-specific recombinase XerD